MPRRRLLAALVAAVLLIAPDPASTAVASCDVPHQVDGEWTRIGVRLPDDLSVTSGDEREVGHLAVDDGDARRLLVGHQAAVAVTLDGGCTWSVAYQPPLLADPGTPSAATSAQVRAVAALPDGRGILLAVQEATGRRTILRSQDNGEAWQVVADSQLTGSPMLPSNATPHDFAVSADGRTVYLALSAGAPLSGGRALVVSRSDDFGQSWKVVGQAELSDSPAEFLKIAMSPSDRDLVLVVTRRELLRSPDGGSGWEMTEVPPERARDIAVSALPGGGTQLELGTLDGELLRSADAGATVDRAQYPGSPRGILSLTPGREVDDLLVSAAGFTGLAGEGLEPRIHRRSGAGWTDVSPPQLLPRLDLLRTGHDRVTGAIEVWAVHTGRFSEETYALWRYDGKFDATPAVRKVGLRRLAGNDRVGTAVAISRDAFREGSAATVLLARAGDFPDALAGTPLGVTSDGPLLLTPGSRLSPVVAEELRRVLPAGAQVLLLGGSAALGEQVEDDVRALGFAVQRIAGQDRFATAVEAARATRAEPELIVVTDGRSFPDALVGGAAAAAHRGVVVLTDGDRLPEVAQDYLDAHPQTPRIAVGGQATRALPDAEAVAGVDRYATAVAVAERLFPTASGVAVASGLGFPDALAGGVHAGGLRVPLLLSRPDAIPQEVDRHLRQRPRASAAWLYGGSVALRPSVEQQLIDALSR